MCMSESETVFTLKRLRNDNSDMNVKTNTVIFYSMYKLHGQDCHRVKSEFVV